MTQDTKNRFKNLAKDSKMNGEKPRDEPRKGRLAAQLRENLLRRKHKGKHDTAGDVSTDN